MRQVKTTNHKLLAMQKNEKHIRNLVKQLNLHILDTPEPKHDEPYAIFVHGAYGGHMIEHNGKDGTCRGDMLRTGFVSWAELRLAVDGLMAGFYYYPYAMAAKKG